MDRRTFIQSTFGFVALTALAGVGANAHSTAHSAYVTPVVSNPEACVGPVMQPGIELVGNGGVVRGMADNTHLFNVDATGAELMRMADGTRTLDELADVTTTPVNAADVASFFVTLGQSGYLANTVLVNLSENVV